MEHAYVDFPLGVRDIQFSIADDSALVGLSKLAAVINKHGCPSIQQISHVGPQFIPVNGLKAVGPSALGEAYMKKTFGKLYDLKPLTVAEIENIIEKFGLAAERVSKAGYNGLEIHAGHNYLMSSFLSGIWNKREDQYGVQSIENRTRFIAGVLKAVRARVGSDFLVGVRMNGGEYGSPDGTTALISREVARSIEAAGANYISVMTDNYGYYRDYPRFPLPGQPQCPNPNLEAFDLNSIELGLSYPVAEAIKKSITIPVFTCGKLNPELGEEILEKGGADVIALGRRILADPDLPNKLVQGKPEDIRPCINCGVCFECNFRGIAVHCQVNAALGKERESEILPAPKRRNMMVVGGGPAGLEAARVAATRGHAVTLYEKEKKLGGLLPLAAMIKGLEYEDVSVLSKYLGAQAVRAGVTIRTGKELTAEAIVKEKPEVVVLAGGGKESSLEIQGLANGNVMTSDELHRRVKPLLRLLGPGIMERLSRVWLPVGKRVLIVGGKIQGCEAAEFLVRRGRQITLVEETDQLGEGIAEFPNRKMLVNWLLKKGVKAFTGVKYREINEKGLVFTAKDGSDQTVEADTILVTLPPQPDTALYQALQGKVPEVYLIGDARQSGLIGEALAEALQIGRSV